MSSTEIYSGILEKDISGNTTSLDLLLTTESETNGTRTQHTINLKQRIFTCHGGLDESVSFTAWVLICECFLLKLPDLPDSQWLPY